MNYEESSRLSLILVASYDMTERKAEVLFYTVKEKPRDPTGNKILREKNQRIFLRMFGLYGSPFQSSLGLARMAPAKNF